MMTIKTQKAPQKSNREQLPSQGSTAVAKMLEAFSLLPLHAQAEGQNQSLRSLVRDITGLSKARIAKGDLDHIRPSTQKKIDRHQQRLIAGQFKDPDALLWFQNLQETAPQTRSGRLAPFASWMHSLQVLPAMPLPMSKEVGLTVDELVEDLLAACRDDDLPKFKQILFRHLEHHGLVIRLSASSAAEPAPASYFTELQALENWSQADGLTNKVIDHLYWDMISALDAEWNSHYFSGRQRMPLFPLVMARLQDGLLERGVASSRKNPILRPSRRLLEFLYALVFKMRYKKWPNKSPSPQVLAGILYRPGEQELLDKSVISSYFDGSTKLTLDLALDYWIQLVDDFLPDLKEDRRPAPPFPMIVLALQWQSLLVQNKGKTILLPDMETYNTLWHHHRQQWELHQSELDKHAPQAGHTNGASIVWPAWAINQSSSAS